MPTWYILRHAQKEAAAPADYNPQLRHLDEPLSAQGALDSQKLCAYFADKQLAAIYVSAYRRTGQTALPTAQSLGLTPVVDARLNEIDNGALEGLPDEEVQQKYADVWQAFVARKADFRFPGGETGGEVQQRLAQFLDEKRQQHPNENILCVAHDGLIRVMMCHILGLPVYQRGSFRIDFCGLVEITYQPNYGCWKLIRFNQTTP